MTNSTNFEEQPIQVICTRPTCLQPNTIPEKCLTAISANEIRCEHCQMPLILRNNFVAEEKIGEGGFGITFRGRDIYEECADKTRVIKLLKLSDGLSEERRKHIRRMFEGEAKILFKLKYERIPQYFASFTMEVDSETERVERFFYLVQEYIEGKSLAQELQEREKFSENEVIEILKEILKILKHIHDYKGGAIHRDIKPANIMRSRDGILYLIDFGAVKQIVKGFSVETTSIVFDGCFAPFEQLQGSKLFPASDIYALGATCLCLLTGNHCPNQLIQESDLKDVLKKEKVRNQRFARTLELMLEPIPKDRPQSAQEVLDILPATLLTSWYQIFLNWVQTRPQHWRSIIYSIFLFLLGIAFVVMYPQIHDMLNGDPAQQDSASNFSRGEESLIPELNKKFLSPELNKNISNETCKNSYNLKQKGMQAFQKASKSGNNQDFQIADNFFTQSIEQARASVANNCIVDPETYIYQYNSKVAQTQSARKGNLPTIAVVIPDQADERDIALETLRGVAQVLQEQDTNSPLFQIVLARKKNEYQEVKKLAGFIADDKIPGEYRYFKNTKFSDIFVKKNLKILGVIGRYTSKYLFNNDPINNDPSLPRNFEGIGEIYGKQKLVLIAPTSTAKRINPEKQSNRLHSYVFRTASNDLTAATNLAEYVWDNLQLRNVLIMANPQSKFSNSLALEVQSQLKDKDKNETGNYEICDLSLSKTNESQCRKKAKDPNHKGIMLFPPSVNSNQYLDYLPEEASENLKIFAGDNLYQNLKIGNYKITIAVSFHADQAKPYFNAKTQELWGIRKVSWRTMTSYDAARVFVEALKNNSNPTRESIYNKLNDQNFSAAGAVTEIKFDPNHDREVSEGVGVLVQLNNSDPKKDEYGFTLLSPELNQP